MILLNYKPVLRQPTGIGVYANAVLPAFDQFEHALIPGGGSGSGKERLKRLAWSQFQLPRMAKKLKADLIFTPAPEGYLGDQTVPQVVMVHDLRPLSHPERSMQSLYFRKWVPSLLHSCAHIVTNSCFTSNEILRNLQIPEERITITPLGYDEGRFYISDAYKLMHSRPYLLHVGQAYPHKNLQRLIYAFKEISRGFPDVDLILLGKEHPVETPRLKNLTSELDLSQRVLFKSYVSYDDLPNWYRGSLAFVYPSIWEGFGLPILEAAACGCPIVTSYGSATEEVARSCHSCLVDPYSIGDIYTSINIILANPGLHAQIARQRISGISKFSWSTTRSLTSHVFQKILTHRHIN